MAAIAISESHNLSAPEGRTPCKIMGLDATCFEGHEGPLLVSEVIGAPGCSDRLFIGATESDTALFGFHWLFEVPYSPIDAARLLVQHDEWLQYAISSRGKKVCPAPLKIGHIFPAAGGPMPAENSVPCATLFSRLNGGDAVSPLPAAPGAQCLPKIVFHVQRYFPKRMRRTISITTSRLK
ncbi:MAG: hypothetical protein ABW061_03125 [Polyangiaceae bacterium]